MPGFPKPLVGKRVLDLSLLYPGPATAATLRTFGAEVTKIEPPTGDPTERLFPETYRLLNRGKTVMRLDLKSEDGKADLARSPQIRPIRIAAGALGENMPSQDLVVSPQHRMLLRDWRCEALFGETEMLAPAKALVNDHSVMVDHEAEEVEYFHFMFEQHEVVLSDGAWTESFQPGDQTLASMGDAQREEIYELFPELAETEGLEAYTAARRSLKKHEARLLL